MQTTTVHRLGILFLLGSAVGCSSQPQHHSRQELPPASTEAEPSLVRIAPPPRQGPQLHGGISSELGDSIVQLVAREVSLDPQHVGSYTSIRREKLSENSSIYYVGVRDQVPPRDVSSYIRVGDGPLERFTGESLARAFAKIHRSVESIKEAEQINSEYFRLLGKSSQIDPVRYLPSELSRELSREAWASIRSPRVVQTKRGTTFVRHTWYHGGPVYRWEFLYSSAEDDSTLSFRRVKVRAVGPRIGKLRLLS
jgi:hypothetical protein